MYSFISKKGETLLSIGVTSRLLVIEQNGSCIKLSGIEVQRIKEMFFKGGFDSVPNKSFSIEEDTISMQSENGVIELCLKDLACVCQYYERHKDRIKKTIN